jgi:hypothetical protein
MLSLLVERKGLIHLLLYGLFGVGLKAEER